MVRVSAPLWVLRPRTASGEGAVPDPAGAAALPSLAVSHRGERSRMEPGEGTRQVEGGPYLTSAAVRVDTGREEPRRLLYFTSGETMGDSSEEEEKEEPEKTVEPSTLPWGHYLWFWATYLARRSLLTCDFLGGKLADLLGLTTPKYQYAVDEYFSVQDQEEDEDGEEVTEMEEMEFNERRHLPIQKPEYGTAEDPGIHSGAETKHQVSYTNEVLGDSGDADN